MERRQAGRPESNWHAANRTFKLQSPVQMSAGWNGDHAAEKRGESCRLLKKWTREDEKTDGGRE